MKLNELLSVLPEKKFCGSAQQEIRSITQNSREASSDSMFVAIAGTKTNGHEYLEDAFQAGARAFVTEQFFDKPGISQATVPDTRTALAALAAQLYGHPSKELTLIGITGTNGKTTTAFLLESIIREAGYTPGLLSTVVYRFGSYSEEADRTTPDQVTLQSILRTMVEAGVRYAVMEVSSHGLEQHRADHCHFDVGIFTNLSPDHLDYHGTMDDYFLSKERLFSHILKDSAKPRKASVINRDDPRGLLLSSRSAVPVISYGLYQGSMHAAETSCTLSGIRTELVAGRDRCCVESPLVGEFNAYNILAAASAAIFLDIPLDAVREGVQKMQGVPGRMERIANEKEIAIFVDYAHTADALENVLATLKRSGAHTIITLFGCGGDRDRGKRPAMGRAAAAYSNLVILTSDNPRTEDPRDIIHDIEKGVLERGFSRFPPGSPEANPEKALWVIEDRRTAIRTAIGYAQRGDAVLIAGKGHETWQYRGGEKIPFDDREEAALALKMCA